MHLFRWFLLVVDATTADQGQDLSHVQDFARFISEPSRFDLFAEEAAARFRVAQWRATSPESAMVSIATYFDQLTTEEELIRDFYRMALRFDPDHLYANNNLGYRLLTQNVNLDEAAELIERAYQTAERTIRDEFRRDFVTDSLGWVRYKQGLIHDEFDEVGRPVREGAVTVLLRAMDRAERHALENRSDEQRAALTIIANHLGDALWMQGDRERAVRTWDQASVIAAEVVTLRELDATELDGLGSAARELRETAVGLRDKLDAARSDRQPLVEPIERDLNTPFDPDSVPAR